MASRFPSRRIWAAGTALVVLVAALIVVMNLHSVQRTIRSALKTGVTLHVWYAWTGSTARVMQRELAAFAALHPGVRVVGTGGITDEALLTAIAAGSPPNVADLDYQKIGEFAQAGWIEPLPQGAEPTAGQDTRASLRTGRYAHGDYGVPFMEDASLLFYNRTLLQKVAASPPQTVTALTYDAQRLTRYSSTGQLLAAGFLPHYPASNLSLYLGAFGAHVVNAQGTRLTPLTPAMVRILRWEDSLYNPHQGAAWTFQEQAGPFPGPRDPFVQGKLAMVVAGEWYTKALARYAPHLNYGVVPFPADAGHRSSVIQGGDWVVPKGATHPHDTELLLRYLSSARVQRAFALASGNLPVNRTARREVAARSPALRPFLAASSSRDAVVVSSRPIMAAYLQALEDAESQVVHGHWGIHHALAVAGRLQHFVGKNYSPIRPLGPTHPLGFETVMHLVTSTRPRGLVYHQTGSPIVLSRSPEAFTRTGILYHTTMSGRFRLYMYQVNESPHATRVGVVFTNPGSTPVDLTLRRAGIGINVYPDVSGDFALTHWLSDHSPARTLARIPPGGSFDMLQAVPRGDTHCALWNLTASTPAGAPARIHLTTVVLPAHGPVNLSGLTLIPHDPNPRGNLPHSEIRAQVTISNPFHPVHFTVGGLDGAYGTVKVPGEYITGVDTMSGRTFVNHGNFGVIYRFTVVVRTPPGRVTHVDVYLQNLGGGGHYVARFAGTTTLTPWVWFYQTQRLGEIRAPAGVHRYHLTISVPGGATGPERIYLVPR